MDILDKFGARTMDILHKWYTQVAPFSISARYSCSAWSNQSSFTLKSLYSNIFHENHDKHKFGEEQWTYQTSLEREQWTYYTSGILKQLLFRFPLDILVQHGRISLVSHSKVFIRIYFMRTMINTSLERNNGHITQVVYSSSSFFDFRSIFLFSMVELVQFHTQKSLFISRTMINTSMDIFKWYKQLLFRFPLDILVQHGRISLVSHSKVFIRIYFMRTMINTSLEREQWTYYTSGILKQLLFRFPLDILVQHGRISLVSHSKVFIRIYFMRTMINTSLERNNGHIRQVWSENNGHITQVVYSSSSFFDFRSIFLFSMVELVQFHTQKSLFEYIS